MQLISGSDNHPQTKPLEGTITRKKIFAFCHPIIPLNERRLLLLLLTTAIDSVILDEAQLATRAMVRRTVQIQLTQTVLVKVCNEVRVPGTGLFTGVVMVLVNRLVVGVNLCDAKEGDEAAGALLMWNSQPVSEFSGAAVVSECMTTYHSLTAMNQGRSREGSFEEAQSGDDGLLGGFVEEVLVRGHEDLEDADAVRTEEIPQIFLVSRVPESPA